MMGDAQQIIYCENSQGKIVIRSAPLEGEINGTPVLDLIASITDGGKPSIKKRVKNTILKNLQNNMKLHFAKTKPEISKFKLRQELFCRSLIISKC